MKYRHACIHMFDFGERQSLQLWISVETLIMIVYTMSILALVIICGGTIYLDYWLHNKS